MGRFGQATNTLSFSFSLLGTSFIIRRLGLNYTIIAFPTCCFAAICGVYMVPNLWTVFCAMLLLKGFSYSLNNPCKEILYQVTSKGTKFKAKSWIDVFGARGSKAAGSIVTNAFSDSATDLLTYGAYVAMGVSSFLIYVAWQMGKMFDEVSGGAEGAVVASSGHYPPHPSTSSTHSLLVSTLLRGCSGRHGKGCKRAGLGRGLGRWLG